MKRTSDQTGKAVAESKAKRAKSKRRRRPAPKATERHAIASIQAAEHIGAEHEAMTWALRDQALMVDRLADRLEQAMFGDASLEKSLTWNRTVYTQMLSALLLTPKSQHEADRIDDLDVDPIETLNAKMDELAARRQG